MVKILLSVCLAIIMSRPCPVLRIRTRLDLIGFLARDRFDEDVETVILDVRAMREEVAEDG